MIDIEIGILQPDLRLELPASEECLPVVRQALRSLGETVAAEREALEDAELAVTEACANAVEHAYDGDPGSVRVTLRPRDDQLLISVRDFGRGMPPDGGARSAGRGYGLAMIEGIAHDVEISRDEGTDVQMAFELGAPELDTVDGAAPGIDPAERILRRLVAVVAAQADLPVDRMMEALLVVELVARNGLRHLVGDRARIRISPEDDGAFELRVGPLEERGADAIVADSEVPVVGPVVQRLADGLRVEHEQVEDADCEYLILRFEPRSA